MGDEFQSKYGQNLGPGVDYRVSGRTHEWPTCPVCGKRLTKMSVNGRIYYGCEECNGEVKE